MIGTSRQQSERGSSRKDRTPTPCRVALGLTPERGLRLSAIMGFGYRLEDTGLQRVDVMGAAWDKNEAC